MSAHSNAYGSAVALLALGLVVKVTLLIACGALAAVVLRHRSAAIRHFAWSLVLGASVGLVLFSGVAPRLVLQLPIGPGTSAARLFQAPAPVHTATPRADDPWAAAATNGAPLSGDDGPRIEGGAHGLTILPAPDGSDAEPLLAALWVLGALLVAARYAAGHAAVRRLVRASREQREGAESSRRRLLEETRVRIAVDRPVRLFVSERLGTPITAGVLNPMIVLPADSRAWSAERLRIVFAHELAHVARNDYLAQLVASVACALFWFHPGVWIAARRLRLEGEQAADDRVLADGTPAVTYATHLLELARANVAPPFVPSSAVGMVRTTQLESRLRAMLDSTRSRSDVPGRVQTVFGVLAALAIVPLSGVRAELTAAGIPEARRPGILTTMTRTIGRVSAADSTFEKFLDAEPGERLELDLGTGGAIVLRAWGERRARLVVRLGGRGWRRTVVDFARVEGGIRLHSRLDSDQGGSSTSHRFELWVPRRFDVRLRSAGGGIVIRDLEGDFRGNTGGGAIDIERAKGRAALSTGGGDIRVADSDLSGTVNTGGGSVVLSHITGGLRGSSGSGPVVYAEGSGTSSGRAEASAEPGGTRSARDRRTLGDLSGVRVSSDEIRASADVGPLNISKAGGSVVLDRMPKGGTVSTGGGGVSVGASAGMLDVTTGGGDVQLHDMAGDARVTTGAGDVTISVINADGSEHSIDVGSGTGRIVVELPREIDARFDVETAYTSRFGRKTRIESDWSLGQEETSEWDERAGTPRKYVRGRGSAGSGRGLIRIRTVNGDVVIRRAGR